MNKRILIATVSLLCLSLFSARARQGDTVRYYATGDPYEGLRQAQVQRKMLLVEFYAPWSTASRWTSEHVIGHPDLRQFLSENFVVVRVETDTPDGASLAADYQVTNYPAVVIFTYDGNVIDKTTESFDREDFSKYLLGIVLSSRRSSTLLGNLLGATEYGPGYDDMLEEYSMRYLTSELPEVIATPVSWPLFENQAITHFYTPAFDYLIAHIDLMRENIGRRKVDELIRMRLYEGAMPEVVGAAEYSAPTFESIGLIARKLNLPDSLVYREMEHTARARAEGNYSRFVTGIGILVDVVPEHLVFPLALSLNAVAGDPDKSIRSAAVKIIDRIEHPLGDRLLPRLKARLK